MILQSITIRAGATVSRSVLFLAFVPAAFGTSVYTVAPIVVPVGFSQVGANQVNDSGQIAGFGYNGTTYQAFIATTSGSTVVPLAPGYTEAFASGINNLGQITGSTDAGGSSAAHAYIGSPTGSAVLPIPDGATAAYGYGINDSGQVVGLADLPNDQQAFTGTLAGSALIPVPDGFTETRAERINSSGQIAGYGLNKTGGDYNAYYQAMWGTTLGLTGIPLPDGFVYAQGIAINDSGEVAGWGFASSGMGVYQQAFVSTINGSTVIPLPPGATNADMGETAVINDAGMVVGDSDVGGWVWDPVNGVHLLSDLTPPGWQFDSAASINNVGQILAYGEYNGGDGQYLLLSPAAVPEPATFGLVGIALLLVGFARRGPRRIRRP